MCDSRVLASGQTNRTLITLELSTLAHDNEFYVGGSAGRDGMGRMTIFGKLFWASCGSLSGRSPLNKPLKAQCGAVRYFQPILTYFRLDFERSSSCLQVVGHESPPKDIPTGTSKGQKWVPYPPSRGTPHGDSELSAGCIGWSRFRLPNCA